MEFVSNLFGLFNHLIDALELLFFGTIAAVVGVSMLPKDNPLYELLVSFTRHMAATFAIAMIALPVQPIPGIDVAHDTLSTLFLLGYWGKFAFDLMKDSSPLRSHPSASDTEGTPREPTALRPLRTGRGTAAARRAPGPVIDAQASDARLYDTERLH